MGNKTLILEPIVKKPETSPQTFSSDWVYASWRFDMWLAGHGSYNDIEKKLATGELTAFTCPKTDCTCLWRHET